MFLSALAWSICRAAPIFLPMSISAMSMAVSYTHLILADNDKGFRDYLEKRLSECFVVWSFDDGQEALEVICEEYPDLVICDIMLKGMSGEELSSKLKTSWRCV